MTMYSLKTSSEQYEIGSDIPDIKKNCKMDVLDLGHGLTFRGKIKKGLPSGFGLIIRQSDGLQIYKGKFKNGVFNGFGIFHDEDGGKYEGEFVNGSYHGYGQLIFTDGT